MRYLELSELEDQRVYLTKSYDGDYNLAKFHKKSCESESCYEYLYGSVDSPCTNVPIDGYVRYVWLLEDIPEETFSLLSDDLIAEIKKNG
jgi:hypothetical protein